MSVADPREPIVSDNGRWLQSGSARYGFAVLAVAIATGLQFGLRLLGPSHLPFMLFYPTVVLVFMLAGFWPGIVATVLAAAGGGYFFLEPTNSFAVHTPEDLVGPALFAVIGVLLTVLTCSRNRAERALRVSEAGLKRAQAVAHLGSWHYDLQGETLALSDEACRILGLPPKAQVSPLQGRDIIHPDDRERAERAWMAALGSGGTYEGESRVLVKGRSIWVRVLAGVEFDAEGRPLAVGTVQDITERKRAGERLQEYEKTLEGLEDMILVLDRDYRYVLANRAFLKYRGLTKEQIVGRRVEELLSPGGFESTVKEKLDECFRGKVVQYEMRYKYPALGERDLFISYFPIEGPGGIDRVACVLQDITEKKQSEHSLKLFRALVDQSNDAVVVIDPVTLRFLDLNEKACKDLGYTREEMLEMTVSDINPVLDGAMRDSVLEKLRTAGFVVQQAVHQRKDGSTFPVETSLRCVHMDRKYLVAVCRDISERKQAEDTLRESEDRYRDLVEHSEDLVCTHDLQGNLLSVNPAPARVLGYEAAEFLKIPMRELIPPEYRELFDAYLVRMKAHGADQGLLCVMTRSGEYRTWEYNNTLRTEGVATPILRLMAHATTQ